MTLDFEKVKEYKKKVIESKGSIDTSYLVFLKEAYREAEMEPPISIRATLFEKLCDNKEIFIDENPIVGSVANGIRAVYPIPEFGNMFLQMDLNKNLKDEQLFKSGLGALGMTEEDRERMIEAFGYWSERGVFQRSARIYNDMFPDEPTAFQRTYPGGLNFEHIVDFHMGAVLLDYGKALSIGFKGIIKEIEHELNNLSRESLESHNKRYFYLAARKSLKASIRLAERYAQLARKMAENEQDSKRYEELLEIAKICEWVPANPARNFREACQGWYFTHLGALMEAPSGSAFAPGRFTQYMYPYYKMDIDNGKITDEEAISLLGYTFLKMQAFGQLHSTHNFASQQGQTAHHISIGGLDENGKCAVNELDYLVVETQKRLKLSQPSLSLYWHDNMPEDFLLKCVELIRTGIGQPQFMNNSRAIERSLFAFPGMTLKEARSIANVGCIPSRPSHCFSNFWGGGINMGKIMEMVLNDGKDPISGLQLGPKTGNAEEFTSFEQVMEAVEKLLVHVLDRHMVATVIGNSVMAEMTPLPYQSCFLDDCIKKGIDVQNGGAKYSTNYVMIHGTVDVGNSLAAIKKLVFEEKRFTIKELKNALAANFEGEENEKIHKLCLNAPKYGNDDEYVDSIVSHINDFFAKEHMKHTDLFGFVAYTEAFSASAHVPQGRFCGALPSGRKAKLPLTDASVSAYPGTDRKGPTALIRSAVKAIDTMETGSNHLNMKFHPSALEGVQGARNLLSLVKTYMDWGGYHVQFNCVSTDTLKDAKQNPGNYRDLVVRVAGFSAYFVNLDEAVQDEIIRRSELKFA